MTHLGTTIAALVDGQLDPEGVERAHAHLARCRPCRDEAELERLTKARLSALAGPEPGDDLVSRLLTLGGPSGPLPPRTGHVPGTPRPQPLRVPSARSGSARSGGTRARVRPAGRVVRREALRLRRPAGARPAPSLAGATSARRPPGRARMAAAVLGALSVVGLGAALSAARVSDSVPVTPPVDNLVVQQVVTTGTLPLRSVPAGWDRGFSTSGIPATSPAAPGGR